MHSTKKTNKSVTLPIIGIISTPHETIQDMPIQPSGAGNIEGAAIVFSKYLDGLKDLDGFSHIILLYHLHKVNDYKLAVTPFMDDHEHGVFATRSPIRPAPIGISIVRLMKIENATLFFEGADMLDGTPLIDIKPFMRQFDNRPHAISGWLDAQEEDLVMRTRSDSRFT